MNKLIFTLLFIVLSVSIFAQTRPDQQPEILTPAGSDAFYSQERGSLFRIRLDTLRGYYAVLIDNVAKAYTPGAGIIPLADRYKIILAADGKRYYIDKDRNYIQIGGGALEGLAAGYGVDIDATDPDSPVIIVDTTQISTPNDIAVVDAAVRSALQDTALAIRSDFPVVPLFVSSFLNDANYVARPELQDTAAAIRLDIPTVPTVVSAFTNDAGYLTTEADGDPTNEGALSVGAGGANSATIVSNTAGSTPVTIEGGANVLISENAGTGTITIASTGGGGGGGTVESVTAELPATVNNTDPANPIVGVDTTILATRSYSDAGDDAVRGELADSLAALPPITDINVGANQVAYGDGTGGLTSNSTFVRVGNNIGINKSNPIATLDVGGSIFATNQTVPSSGAGVRFSYFIPLAIGQIISADFTAGQYRDINIGAQSIRFSTQLSTNLSIERMRLGLNGFLGLGTTTPAYIFDINSTNAVKLPVGTTVQRPTGVLGVLRGNSTTSGLDFHDGTAYRRIAAYTDVMPSDGQQLVYSTANGAFVPTTISEGGGGDVTTAQLADSTAAIRADFPTVPTAVSAFTNDAGYLTSEVDGSVSNEGALTAIAGTPLESFSIRSNTAGSSDLTFFLGDNMSGTPLTPNSVSLYADDNQTAAEVPATPFTGVTGTNVQAQLEEVQGNIPTNVSELTNDAGYLTDGDDLGDHTATQDIHLGGNAIKSDVSGVSGIRVSGTSLLFDTEEASATRTWSLIGGYMGVPSLSVAPSASGIFRRTSSSDNVTRDALWFRGNTYYTQGDTPPGTLTTARILTTQDLGAGRALDADLLDGQQGSYYYSPANPPPAGSGDGNGIISALPSGDVSITTDKKFTLVGTSDYITTIDSTLFSYSDHDADEFSFQNGLLALSSTAKPQRFNTNTNLRGIWRKSASAGQTEGELHVKEKDASYPIALVRTKKLAANVSFTSDEPTTLTALNLTLGAGTYKIEYLLTHKVNGASSTIEPRFDFNTTGMEASSGSYVSAIGGSAMPTATNWGTITLPAYGNNSIRQTKFEGIITITTSGTVSLTVDSATTPLDTFTFYKNSYVRWEKI